MEVTFGTHKGLDVRRLILQHPDYVKWVLGQERPTGGLRALADSIRGYIRVFDAKPFVEQCMGRIARVPCKGAVTRGTAYHSHSGLSVDLVWWCATCDPYQLGAVATLIDVNTYSSALSVVDRYGGRASDYVDIIKQLSRAKGMTKRVTRAALDAFFGP